ncbi:hypothetical protein [Bacillus coahuilensis]|uniref:hypothetical protein n=1 Tax=Bacillus coahuilensis TaxID=408580 RepID=UPI0001851318|nr:hypothetical protein [Bacillus coahuilensis]
MNKTLGEAYSEIMDRVIEILKNECNEEGKLPEINRVIRGDRTRGVIKPPVLWVYQEQLTHEVITSRMEEWTLPLVLVAVYQSNDPEKGHINSTDIVDRARTIILRDRHLGGLSFVFDVKSGPFEPSSPLFSDKDGVYGAGAVLNIHFKIFRD